MVDGSGQSDVEMKHNGGGRQMMQGTLRNVQAIPVRAETIERHTGTEKGKRRAKQCRKRKMDGVTIKGRDVVTESGKRH